MEPPLDDRGLPSNSGHHALLAVPSLPQPSDLTIGRSRWQTWASAPKPTWARTPEFGDYTVQHPVFHAPPSGADPSASIRYAAEDYWVIMRGGPLRSKKTTGNKQYYGDAQLPCERDDFKGAAFTRGDHFTQRTWTRLGATYTFGTQQVSAFLNAGIAENTDALSTFRMGGGLRLRAEFPLLLHGYYVEEIFARRFWLVNLAYRFPIWPGQDLVHLQLLADFAQVDYVQGHHLPRSNLPGVGANLSIAVAKRIDLVVGYGYGINAPRGNSFGGQEFDAQFQFKY